ncbi:hypothetical protein DERF_006626 [Dermatophagoides farinae]|uniref:Uncharacterized protein n=1 Tax=Dermatophagoides farinae TaxID=6954 RepID=A0A922HZE4_DERFA|nr:hypothetical protein DERF_006626 [Dermatophagoides farinae]
MNSRYWCVSQWIFLFLEKKTLLLVFVLSPFSVFYMKEAEKKSNCRHNQSVSQHASKKKKKILHTRAIFGLTSQLFFGFESKVPIHDACI